MKNFDYHYEGNEQGHATERVLMKLTEDGAKCILRFTIKYFKVDKAHGLNCTYLK